MPSTKSPTRRARTQVACLNSCRPCRYVLPFFPKLAPCLVGIEACASSHHWSRELQALGHTMRLMPSAKPYVKRQKNDAAPHLLSVNPGAQSLG
jgi:hypothetical protein